MQQGRTKTGQEFSAGGADMKKVQKQRSLELKP